MVKLIIQSSDAFGEKVLQELLAEKRVQDDSITYNYEDGFGQTAVTIFKDYITILREGEITSRQIFKLMTSTDFFYSTKYFKNDFTIYTTFMEYNNGILTLSYKIFDGQEEVNSLNITIEEK